MTDVNACIHSHHTKSTRSRISLNLLLHTKRCSIKNAAAHFVSRLHPANLTTNPSPAPATPSTDQHDGIIPHPAPNLPEPTYLRTYHRGRGQQHELVVGVLGCCCCLPQPSSLRTPVINQSGSQYSPYRYPYHHE